MALARSEAIAEKNRQYQRARLAFVEHLPNGELYEGGGVVIASGGVQWAAMNNAFLASPVEHEKDLRDRIAVAQEFFRRRRLGWRFTICTEWVGGPLQCLIGAIFEEHGLSPRRELIGMVATGLSEPVRPLPQLDYRYQNGVQARLAFARINSTCHAVPEAWMTEIISPDALWTSGFSAFVGETEQTSVTTALVGAVENAIYVGWVATLPDWRCRGCAEAIVRYSLRHAQERFGIERSFLHASSGSARLFERMGYSPVATFRGYSTT